MTCCLSTLSICQLPSNRVQKLSASNLRVSAAREREDHDIRTVSSTGSTGRAGNFIRHFNVTQVPQRAGRSALVASLEIESAPAGSVTGMDARQPVLCRLIRDWFGLGTQCSVTSGALSSSCSNLLDQQHHHLVSRIVGKQLLKPSSIADGVLIFFECRQ